MTRNEWMSEAQKKSVEAHRWMQVATAQEQAARSSTGDQKRRCECAAMDAWNKVDQAKAESEAAVRKAA